MFQEDVGDRGNRHQVIACVIYVFRDVRDENVKSTARYSVVCVCLSMPDSTPDSQ